MTISTRHKYVPTSGFIDRGMLAATWPDTNSTNVTLPEAHADCMN